MNNISRSKTIAMNLINTTEVGPQDESKSVFQGEGYQILVGRRHKGDENDSTWCKFASLSLEGVEVPSWIAGVIVQKVREVEIKKESESDIQCSDGEVIMGRTHIGDENDPTTYTIGEVILLIEVEDDMYLRARGCCVHIEKEEITCGESEGKWMEVEGKCIVGRKHIGDENKDTTYTFAKIAIELNPLI